nr:MFS transporter [Natronomonas gomsonensis]
MYSLYLTRFSAGFGLVTLLTLLPTYIDLLEPSALLLGLFTTGLTLAQTAAIVPFAYGGDRGDKRLVLLVALAIGMVGYAAFAFVETGGQFVLARGAQGIAATGTGLMTLALVGELAPAGETANYIGKANAARFAASVGGTLSAGALYQTFGFDAVFGVLVALMAIAFLGLALFCPPDETRSEFSFLDLAVNRRLLTLSSFRAPYAVSVTLVRTWVPIFAGVSAARGGLAYAAFAVSIVIAAEKATNMVCQPFTGRLSDRVGRAWFVALGGGAYGLVALAVPFAPAAGAAFGVPATYGPLGELSAAFLPLVGLNAALGVADSLREPASMALFADEGADEGGIAASFGVRELVWRPGSVVAPILGGFLMVEVSMTSVFYVGGASALVAVGAFLTVLVVRHGTDALRAW